MMRKQRDIYISPYNSRKTYQEHLVIDSEGKFADALEWIRKLANPTIVKHVLLEPLGLHLVPSRLDFHIFCMVFHAFSSCFSRLFVGFSLLVHRFFSHGLAMIFAYGMRGS